MALVARLARTLRFQEPEHLPLEFGSFVAASGFLAGALIAFLATSIGKKGLASKFSRLRFILILISFGIATGFIRGILNPISVSTFELYKGFLTFEEFFDLVANHLFRFYLNAMIETAFTIFTGLLGGAILSTGALLIWLIMRSKTPVIRHLGSLSVMLVLSITVILISSTGPPGILAKLD